MTSAPEPAAPTSVPIDGRRLRRENNARRLYDAATQLLAERAYDNLSVEEICERAGVGRATFFRIFETKAGLLREFNRRLTADAESRLAAIDGSDVGAQLDTVRRAITDAWRDAGEGHVGMAVEYRRLTPSGEMHTAHPELLDLVTGIVSDAIDRGELTNAIPPRLAGALAVVHLSAAIAHSLAGQDVDIDELSEALLDQWLKGMQP